MTLEKLPFPPQVATFGDVEKLIAHLAFQNEEKEKREAELIIANKELAFQNDEKEKRAAELVIANNELANQCNETAKLAEQLKIANSELTFQYREKEKLAAKLMQVNTRLTFQNYEKEKRAMELIEANKDLTSFTHVSSHDLQEPLRKIQNFMSLMLDQEKDTLSDEGQLYLEKVNETATRMRVLLDDLLIYSGSKNGTHVIERVNINAVVDEVIYDFKEAILEKKVTINVKDLGEANVICFQFRQVIQNLIGNSLKFLQKGVEPCITIKSEIIEGARIKNSRLSPSISYFHLVYKDNGIGFDPQYKDRIFEEFQRLHSKDDYQGTGMGLAICKRIIENHSGIISAKGKPDHGARFDIYIPA